MGAGAQVGCKDVEAHGRDAFRERVWPRLIGAVETAKRCAKPDGDVDEGAYLGAHVPCAFLETESRTCSVYRDRPVSCRSLLVLSPPEACNQPGGKRWQIDTSDHAERAYRRHWEVGARERVGRPALGFLSDFVMRAARRMGAAPDDE